MLEQLVIACLLGIPTSYIVSILLFDFQGGPFTNYKVIVQDDRIDTGSFWYLSFFDRIRQLVSLNTIYKKNEYGHWLVNRTNMAELFSCPYCLSFWVALIINLMVFPISFHFILYWLSCTAISTIINKKLL